MVYTKPELRTIAWFCTRARQQRGGVLDCCEDTSLGQQPALLGCCCQGSMSGLLCSASTTHAHTAAARACHTHTQDKNVDGDSSESKEAKEKKAKAEAKALKEAFKPLTSWWKEQLEGKVCVCGGGIHWGGACRVLLACRCVGCGDPHTPCSALTLTRLTVLLTCCRLWRHSPHSPLTPSCPLQVSNVKLSKRLASTPAVVVASKWGQSAHMERIMKASVSEGVCVGGGG